MSFLTVRFCLDVLIQDCEGDSRKMECLDGKATSFIRKGIGSYNPTKYTGIQIYYNTTDISQEDRHNSLVPLDGEVLKNGKRTICDYVKRSAKQEKMTFKDIIQMRFRMMLI